MAINCCKLVGNFPVAKTGIISVSHRIGTEAIKIGTGKGQIIKGPTIGTVTITAYAKDAVHNKCAGRVSLSIPWIRKYDCDLNKIFFIFAGEGQSNISGDIDGLASLNENVNNYRVLSASASSGPSSIFEDDTQYDGYGLVYKGGPWEFDTKDKSGLTIDTGIGSYGVMYLQSFSLQCTPNQVPTANYDFVFAK